MLVISSLLGASHTEEYEKREWLGCRKDSLPDAEYIELKSVKDHVWIWFNSECSGWIVDLSKCVGGIG